MKFHRPNALFFDWREIRSDATLCDYLHSLAITHRDPSPVGGPLAFARFQSSVGNRGRF